MWIAPHLRAHKHHFSSSRICSLRFANMKWIPVLNFIDWVCEMNLFRSPICMRVCVNIFNIYTCILHMHDPLRSDAKCPWAYQFNYFIRLSCHPTLIELIVLRLGSVSISICVRSELCHLLSLKSIYTHARGASVIIVALIHMVWRCLSASQSHRVRERESVVSWCTTTIASIWAAINSIWCDLICKFLRARAKDPEICDVCARVLLYDTTSNCWINKPNWC